MGIFKSIGGFFKKIWDGITRVFSKIMKPIAKLLDSKLGKALMLAVSIFTMGTALLAGVKGFASASGFINKFVAGGQEFINSLLGTEFGKGAGGGKVPNVPGAPGEGAVGAGDILTGGDPTAIGGIKEAASVGAVPAIGDPNAIALTIR